MLHTIFIKCKVDVLYFIFIFISPSVARFSVKKSVNQLIKNKRPNYSLQTEKYCLNVSSTAFSNCISRFLLVAIQLNVLFS